MKKIYLISVLLIFSKLCAAQVTNTFPANGNVGIGTLNPGANISFKGVNEGLESRGITWYSDKPEAYGIFRTSGDWTDPNYQQLKLAWETGIILNPGNDYVKSFVDIQGGGLRVTSGNVGIGTSNPSSILSIAKNGTGLSFNPGGAPYFGTIALNRESATGTIFDSRGNAYQINNGGSDKNLHFQVYNGSGDMVTNDALVITGEANVGIGTAKPSEKLSVNGKIRAHEIKVETANWPYYVFKSDYQLLPLSELESFVKTYNHLPEIPAASVIENDGLLLGEMNKKMIKKIEEMTLYIIDQQKLIEAQNKRLEKLEQLIIKHN